jgi:hypothetical protein
MSFRRASTSVRYERTDARSTVHLKELSREVRISAKSLPVEGFKRLVKTGTASLMHPQKTLGAFENNSTERRDGLQKHSQINISSLQSVIQFPSGYSLRNAET